jgi:hypothetical protein
MFVMQRGPRYSGEEAAEAIAASRSFTDALRRLGMRPAGGNHATLKKYAALWSIPTDHFDPHTIRLEALRRGRVPLARVLVEDSTFSRGHLKERLYAEGLKDRRCDLCGQGEIWRGQRMSLILDHANGIANDHRLENLRIVCPNCAATFNTHCGRNLPLREKRRCRRCDAPFWPRYREQRYCSRPCGNRHERHGIPRPRARRVERPPYEQLLAEVEELGYCCVGRRYGVSDNAIRKWLRQYERERDERVELRQAPDLTAGRCVGPAAGFRIPPASGKVVLATERRGL